MLLLAPEPAPASAPVRPEPLEPAPPPEAATPKASESIVASELALKVMAPAALMVEPSMCALMKLPIALVASAAPTDAALPLPVLAPAAIATAIPPASAVIVEVSVALKDTAPFAVVVTRDLLIDASRLLWIELSDSAPAPESARPLFWPPVPVSAPPRLNAVMSAVDFASSVTAP